MLSKDRKSDAGEEQSSTGPPWVVSGFWVCWGMDAGAPGGGEARAELHVEVQRGREDWAQLWAWEARSGTACGLELGCTKVFGLESVRE